MKPITEVLSRYKTIAAASRATGVAPKLLHENIARGALVEPDGTIWIRSKTKLKMESK
ncbi:hypothetical protein [uncultured Alteromonas sp.]|uniref:hypothetical protein n=1 Tax=uncultured Alteromonas sp. TaxID=179113 RepID=UPI0030ECD958|tara:strand:- start:1861 stop:2034 length:174 start_codon:yes stop_codon:yes gene_type:complete